MTGFNARSRGNIGEDLAVAYLLEKGYEVQQRNATFLGGELDIICTKEKLWRFVEVKYRENTIFGFPEESMTPKKVKNLLRSIMFYCLKNNLDFTQARLDFLGILRFPDGTYEYRLVEDVN